MLGGEEIYLIAQGEDPSDRWRKPLPLHTPVCLGRTTGAWSIPWDPHISRRHAEVIWDGNQLHVRRLPSGRNPLFFHGEERDSFEVKPGEHFVIGRTRFALSRQRVAVSSDHPTPTQQEAFAPHLLRQIVFRNPNTRMEVLSRLPRAISTASAEPATAARLVSLILAGMPNAEAVAVVAIESPASLRRPEDAGDAMEHPSDRPMALASKEPSSEATLALRVIHWDRRLLADGEFRPSRRLILEAWNNRQSVLHIWREKQRRLNLPGKAPGTRPSSVADTTAIQPKTYHPLYTMEENIDWAICTPIHTDVCNWVIYAAGTFHRELGASDTTPEDLREDVKFLELVGEMTGAILQLKSLERRQAVLGQFLPRPVLDRLTEEDPETLLSPQEVDVTVLFCDLRGFSQETERHAERLLPLLNRISAALSVMTRHILEQGGVIGDFQGDAAMGFWGWPIPQEDRALRACQAALAIRREFEQASQSPDGLLAGFQIGIGIASGRAVAGKIGTAEHAKVTVFGPPVNLASRLEGLTKLLHVPVLLDEATAQAVRASGQKGTLRVRPLARLRPYGFDQAVLVHELLPPGEEYPLLTDEHLALCEAAVRYFLEGRWNEAFDLLHRLPASDRGADFLTSYITQHHRQPPPGWDGVIILSSK